MQQHESNTKQTVQTANLKAYTVVFLCLMAEEHYEMVPVICYGRDQDEALKQARDYIFTRTDVFDYLDEMAFRGDVRFDYHFAHEETKRRRDELEGKHREDRRTDRPDTK